MFDKEVIALEAAELERQNNGIELIASENYPSASVRQAMATVFSAKYAEGYPGKRYYGGCEVVDQLENLAIERCKALFDVKFANVQPHSGSQANFSAYAAVLNPGDRVLSLNLNDGGHLTHGSPVSFSAKTYEFHHYDLGVDAHLDLDIIAKRLDEVMPHLFLAGYSAYPYDIDFQSIRRLIDEHNARTGNNCLFMVDMAHIAGIVAAKLCQNPCDYADIVTSTTHKTLRGPRGGIILTNDEEIARRINKAVFPYAQGGPLEHTIAAKGTCFLEAMEPSFVEYARRVLENTKACNDALANKGRSVSGTENHLFLLDVHTSYGLTGLDAQKRLESIGITVNKNQIHNDPLPPSKSSGVRIGFAAVTSRGCDKNQAEQIGFIIDEALAATDEESLEPLKQKVAQIVSAWKDISKLDY